MTEAARGPEAYPSSLRAWALVGIFFLASIVNTIDRGILAIVVDPVRHDLGISDVQISLLQGLSFGIFYVCVGVPLGLVADRTSRKWLIIAGVTVWSGATIAAGLTHNFQQMFLTRLLVGLGEATLAPCAVSMISDMFPPHQRGRPLGVYLMGQAVSGGLSIFLLGAILGAAPKGAFDAFPGAHGAAPWRIAFVIAGMTGAVVIALMLLIREPVRRGVMLGRKRGLGVGEAARYLGANIRVFAPFYLGFSLIALAYYGLSAWSVAMLMRHFGANPAMVGKTLGGASLVAGVAGTAIAGLLIDALARRRVKTAKLLMLCALPLCAAPAMLAGFAPSLGVAVVLLSVMTMVYPMVGTSMIAAVQEMTPNNMRGVAVSLFGLLNTVIGSIGGPLLIALATEHLFDDPKKVGQSIALVGGIALVASALTYGVALIGLRASLRNPTSLNGVMTLETA